MTHRITPGRVTRMPCHLRVIAATLSLSIAGCVTQPTNVETLQAFLSGSAALKNSTLPIGEYVQLRPKMWAAFHGQDWAGLSQLVLQAGFDNDLSWYYLGASAEGLGYLPAAKIYFMRSVQSVHHCNGQITGDMCGGSRLPADAIAGYRRVATALSQAGNTC